jgi:hypothetical protein
MSNLKTIAENVCSYRATFLPEIKAEMPKKTRAKTNV